MTPVGSVALTVSAVTETTATLTLANHTAAWWYQGNQGGAQCTSVAQNTTTASLTGLTGGTTYTYKAYSAAGCNATNLLATAPAFTTVGLTAGSVTQTGATLTLANWPAAWWHQGNQGGAQCTSVAANTTTASLTGLTGGTDYTWTVYSASGCNASAKLADVAFTTPAPATKPAAPATPTATWGDGTVTLTWTAPDNGGSPITDYDYQTRNQTDGGAWTEYDATDTSTATTKTLTGLTNGKTWRLRVRASNAVGDSNWSWPFAEVVVGSPAPVAAPTLVALGSGQVKVLWTAPANNGSAVTSYSLWHKQGTGNWTEVPGVAGSATAHTLTLTAGQTYVIGVEAHNARGGSNPAASSFGGATTSTSMAVTLTASAVTETTATLTLANWTAAWWYQGDQGGAQCTSVAANTTTASLTGLTGGTTYTYKAYGATGCNATDLLATAAAFTTTQPAATVPLAPTKPDG